MSKKELVSVMAAAAGLALGSTSLVVVAEGSSEQAADSSPGLVGPKLESEPITIAPFSELDTDGDELISREEAQASEWLADNWNEADINQDGSLDKAEFSAFETSADPRRLNGTPESGQTDESQPNPSVAGARESSEDLTPEEIAARADEQRGPLPPFEQIDANGDGKLDENEVAEVEPLNVQFQAADVDQDGAIDEAEFSAFEARIGVMPGAESPALEERPAEEVPGDTTATE